MKHFLSFLTGATLTVLPSFAADRDLQRGEHRSDVEDKVHRGRMAQSERLGLPYKASELMGKEITSPQNENLGKVDELGIDLPAGRVAWVVVRTGGVLGVGGRTIAVPPRRFSFDANTKTLRLDVDKEKLQGAPVFESSRWDDTSPTNYLWETYRYYGHANVPADARPKTAVPEYGHHRDDLAWASPGSRIEKASKIIGLKVVGRDDEKYGDVDNLMVDLPAGRVVHVILSSGGFLGIGDALNAVPPAALRFNDKHDALVLNANKDQLTRAPRFKHNEWPEFGDSVYSREIYRSYGVEPYFGADADNTRRNVRDRRDSTLTPIDQGSTEGDVTITRRIRQDLVARDGLSVNARNVKIITADGRVTLRGPVNSAAEKDLVGEIAGRIAQPANVDNQIEVKRAPDRE